MDALRIGLVLITFVACISDESSNNVTCMKTLPVPGGNITLTCALPESEIFQLTWKQKKTGNEPITVASDSEHGPKVNPEFSSYIVLSPRISEGNSTKSSITILFPEKEDEACYIIYFNRKHRPASTGDICLKDIAPSNEVTCLSPGAPIGIRMNPHVILTRRSQQDFKRSGDGNMLLRGRFFDARIKPACTFFKKAANTTLRKPYGQKMLKERQDEVVLQCEASMYGTKSFQIQWNITGYEVAKNITTNGNVTTVTSSLTLPLSLLTHDQTVSCDILLAAKGNLESLEEVKTIQEWVWVLLAIALPFLTAAVFGIWKFCRSSRRNDKTNKDIIQSKNTEEEETPTEFCEYRDETPTKDKNNGRPNNGSSYSPRKLEF